ncbi:MAG: PKD domain-containing protein [Spirosomataceae bacterium]
MLDRLDREGKRCILIRILIFTVIFGLRGVTFAQNCDKPIHVVVMGSSTAAGMNASVADSAWAFRYQRFLMNLSASNRLTNLAMGGYTTYHLSPSWLVAPANRPAFDPDRNITRALALKPDAIILNLTSNDIAQDFDIEETKINYNRIVSVADSAKVPIWVTTSQPRSLNSSQMITLLKLRDWLRERFGDKCLDFWTGFGTPDGYLLSEFDSGDHIHMNNKGHRILYERVMAKKIHELVCKVTTNPPPVTPVVANFQVEVGWAGSETAFKDLSEGSPTAWEWSFGDGEGSKLQHPKHIYAKAGNYTVKMIASRGSVSSTLVSKTITIQAPAVTLKPNFSVKTAVAGEATQFTDLTEGGPTGWSWDFGDGQGANEQHPKHIYAKAGTYVVKFIASKNGVSSNLISKEIVIEASPVVLKPNFLVKTAVAGEATQFTDLTEGSPTGWSWDFGDGQGANEQHPKHMYAKAGTYVVKFIASKNGVSSNLISKEIVIEAAPVVLKPNFSVKTAVAGEATQFTDLTEGGPTGWSWVFGDGQGANEQNPKHIYAKAGTYVVKFFATKNGVSSNLISKEIVIESAPVVLKPDFSVKTAVAGEATQFTDLTEGGPTGWSWDFGDGQGANEQNPKHIYAKAGTYVVKFFASKATTKSAVISKEVVIESGVKADFTVTVAVSGDTTQFIDQSEGAPTNWLWDFGDGQSSKDRNPIHIYAQPGDYEVTLTASNPKSKNSITKKNTVDDPLVADFQTDIAQSGDTTRFADVSKGRPVAWQWDFGDGQTASVRHPKHVYKQAGKYQVKLIITKPNAPKSTKFQEISVVAAPVITSTITLPLHVQFHLYPNPSAGVFQLRMWLNEQQTVYFEILSEAGHLLHSSQHTGPIGESFVEHDFRHLPAGFYLYRIRTDLHNKVGKMVIHN